VANDIINKTAQYTDEDITKLPPREQVRLRPGMWIGKLGDGSLAEDGIYTLIKEVVDNSVDEFTMGYGSQIDITIEDKWVTIRDYGRGIPLNMLDACVGEMNVSGKYNGAGYKKTVGLNGVGLKAVNYLSAHFEARSVRDGQSRTVTFEQGNLTLSGSLIQKIGTSAQPKGDTSEPGVVVFIETP
jgi:topoisomerase-4 subunit B